MGCWHPSELTRRHPRMCTLMYHYRYAFVGRAVPFPRDENALAKIQCKTTHTATAALQLFMCEALYLLRGMGACVANI